MAAERKRKRRERESVRDINMNVIRLPRCQSAIVAGIMCERENGRGRLRAPYVVNERWESFDDCTAGLRTRLYVAHRAW